MWAGSADGRSNGALYSIRTNGNSGIAGSAQNRGEYRQFGFGASRSNPIYGGSSTVQPSSMSTLLVVKY